MRIINVVRIKNGVLDNIDSFGVYEEQLVQDVVKVAEAEFIKQVKELGWCPDDHWCETEDELLEEAYYETDNGDVNVCISWSDIE